MFLQTGFGIIGFRDPHGIRPIGFAKRQSPKGTDYMFASESVVCDGCSFTDFEDLKPGEAVIVNKNLTVTRRQLIPEPSFSPCIFEYVYFSRPDSIIDGISVYKCRLAMGEALADQVTKKLGPNMDVDVIIPVSSNLQPLVRGVLCVRDMTNLTDPTTETILSIGP